MPLDACYVIYPYLLRFCFWKEEKKKLKSKVTQEIYYFNGDDDDIKKKILQLLYFLFYYDESDHESINKSTTTFINIILINCFQRVDPLAASVFLPSKRSIAGARCPPFIVDTGGDFFYVYS
jgi:hypothetical protein